jgi:hypothetical protein
VDPKKLGPKRLYINSLKGDASLLVEAESDALAEEWVATLREHVSYVSQRLS